ncbi:ComEC/Rec2 family competence protein [Acidipropionibacterium jensenii]|uniref:ComEC/Rec2 family competence protein n=1 Tax=Acidipropionibacterium jensenii TaxID=1749 RepID=UPI00214AE970|nr:ComEC/Rec2 family competence protein [Acidipropionibacterium jensenii]
MSGSETLPAPRPDLRTLPLAMAAVATSWLATSGQRLPVVVAVVVGLVMLLVGGARRSWWLAGFAAVTAVLATLGGLRAQALHEGPVAQLAAQRAAVTVVATVTSDPHTVAARGPRAEMVLVHIRTVEVSARGQQIRVRTPLVAQGGSEIADLRVGSTVELTGLLRPADPQDSHAGWLRLRSAPRPLAGPGVLDRAVNRTRDGLVSSVALNRPAQKALVPSLVVGDTSAVPEQITADFKATSLTHLMAVSGANLATTTALLWWLGSWLGMRRRGLRAMSVCGVVVFVIICRAEPSVIRAAAMGIVMLAAAGLAFDRAAGLRALCVAVLGLMAVDPWLSRSVGFWLSVCATAGILCWTTGWARAMWWLPQNLARAIVVPWAAQLATQPIITWLSDQVSTTGLLANLTAAPFVGPATVLGMSAAVLSAVWPPLGMPFGWLAGWAFQPILWIAELGASAPAAAFQWPATPALLAVLGGLCLAVSLVTPWLLAGRWRCLLAAVLVVLATVIRPPVAGWPGDWQAAACDVGQGTAVAIRAGPGAAVLADTGPESEPMIRCLAELGVRRIPVLILSHYHADHIGGAQAVLERGGVQLVLVSPLAAPAAEARRIAAAAASAGVGVRVARAGDAVQAGQLRLEILWSGPVAGDEEAGSGESSAENNSSIVVRAVGPELTMMLTGDVEPLAQRAARRAAASAGMSLQADVLVMPHHGSSRQDEAFWRATGAHLAIASAGVDNSYGHPAAAAVKLARSLGMQVRRTDQQGSVAVDITAAAGGDALVTRTRR